MYKEVALVLEMIASDMSIEEILEEYPHRKWRDYSWDGSVYGWAS